MPKLCKSHHRKRRASHLAAAGMCLAAIRMAEHAATWTPAWLLQPGLAALDAGAARNMLWLAPRGLRLRTAERDLWQGCMSLLRNKENNSVNWLEKNSIGPEDSPCLSSEEGAWLAAYEPSVIHLAHSSIWRLPITFSNPGGSQSISLYLTPPS